MVIPRLPRGVVNAMLVFIVPLAGCSGFLGGDRPARATIGWVTYDVGVVRDIQVSAEDLAPAGAIDAADDPSQFAEMNAYLLRGVDPKAFLVVPAKPGLRDDAGPWVDYLALWETGQALPAVCQYFPADSATKPTGC